MVVGAVLPADCGPHMLGVALRTDGAMCLTRCRFPHRIDIALLGVGFLTDHVLLFSVSFYEPTLRHPVSFYEPALHFFRSLSQEREACLFRTEIFYWTRVFVLCTPASRKILCVYFYTYDLLFPILQMPQHQFVMIAICLTGINWEHQYSKPPWAEKFVSSPEGFETENFLSRSFSFSFFVIAYVTCVSSGTSRPSWLLPCRQSDLRQFLKSGSVRATL